MTPESEASALSTEWNRLRSQHAALSELTRWLRPSRDLRAARAHLAFLQDYVRRVQAWAQAAEIHQHQGSSIGGLTTT